MFISQVKKLRHREVLFAQVNKVCFPGCHEKTNQAAAIHSPCSLRSSGRVGRNNMVSISPCPWISH